MNPVYDGTEDDGADERVTSSAYNFAFKLPEEPDPEVSIQRGREAIEIARRYGDEIAEASIQCGLSKVFREVGRLDEAMQAVQTALEICQRRNAKVESIYVLINLGHCLLQIGDPARGFGYLAEAEVLAMSHGTRVDQSEVFIALCAGYGGMRSPEKALEYAFLLINEYWDALPRLRQVATLNNTGSTLIDLGRHDEAAPYIERGLALLEGLPDEIPRAFLLGNKAVVLSKTDDVDAVAQTVGEIHAIATRCGREMLMAGTMEELGVSYLDKGEVDRAIACLERSKEVATEFSMFHILRTVSKHLARAYEESGQYEKANKELRYALAMAEESLHKDIDVATKYALLRQEADFVRRESELMRVAKEQAEKASRAKTEFLANVSHELRTPLNGVLGVASMLMGTGLTSEQREYANLIRVSGDALLDVIGNVLDISQIEAGKFSIEQKEFNLVQMYEDVSSALAMRAHEKGVELNLSIPFDFPSVLVGDEGRLRQVMMNLVGNATKFTEEGEILIEVSFDYVSDDRIRMKTEITDTGIGVTEDRQEAVFESFTQADGSTRRRFGGTGLGLSISKKLVEMMDGEIGLSSESNVGSVFWFDLELDVSPNGYEKSLYVGSLGQRIALVGENRVTLDVLSRNLRGFGFETETLESVEEISAKPNLIVVDHSTDIADLQDRIGAVRARFESEQLPLILLGRIGQAGTISVSSTIDASYLLLKPVRRERLWQTVTDILRAPAASSVVAPVLLSELGSLRVLVAEDNDVNQVVAQHFLNSIGCTVEIAGNGKAAVELFKKEPFDLILMDCQMPDIDGYQATMQIRRLEAGTGRRIPIVAMTANVAESDREACLAAGMDDFISKPMSGKDLEQVIRRTLGGG